MIAITAFLLPLFTLSAPNLTEEKPSQSLAALEHKLHGVWKGPACGGEWKFLANGTFEVKYYSPAGDSFTGTWKIVWDELPPTLILTRKTSDDAVGLPVGKVEKVKITRLDESSFSTQRGKEEKIAFTRVREKK